MFETRQWKVLVFLGCEESIEYTGKYSEICFAHNSKKQISDRRFVPIEMGVNVDYASH